jgi:F-type H+-transporting ATPase subunit b
MIEIHPDILLAQAITFLLAVFVLWKVAWKPLCSIMQQRAKTIEHDLSEAQRIKEEVQKLETNYKAQLDHIQQQTQQMLDQARADAAQQRDEILRQTKTEADSILEKSRLQLEEERKALLQQLYRDMSVASVELAERLLRQSINKETQDRCLNESLDKVDQLIKHHS